MYAYAKQANMNERNHPCNRKYELARTILQTENIHKEQGKKTVPRGEKERRTHKKDRQGLMIKNTNEQNIHTAQTFRFTRCRNIRCCCCAARALSAALSWRVDTTVCMTGPSPFLSPANACCMDMITCKWSFIRDLQVGVGHLDRAACSTPPHNRGEGWE